MKIEYLITLCYLYKYCYCEIRFLACDNHRKSICACQITLNHNNTFSQTFNQRHIHVPNTNTSTTCPTINSIQRLQAAWFYNTSPNQTPHYNLYLPLYTYIYHIYYSLYNYVSSINSYIFLSYQNKVTPLPQPWTWSHHLQGWVTLVMGGP
jgi:hypothetical protein